MRVLTAAAISLSVLIASPPVVADNDLDLLTAARSGNNKRLKELVMSGTSPNGARDDRLGGALPLAEAIANNHLESAAILISAGADVNRFTGLGSTALIIATYLGNEESVRALLNAGANPNILSRDGWGPLQIAARDGQTDIVRVLLERGANKDHRLPDGNTALSWARARGHKAVESILRSSH